MRQQRIRLARSNEQASKKRYFDDLHSAEKGDDKEKNARRFDEKKKFVRLNLATRVAIPKLQLR
jgi:hypothetical protein